MSSTRLARRESFLAVLRFMDALTIHSCIGRMDFVIDEFVCDWQQSSSSSSSLGGSNTTGSGVRPPRPARELLHMYQKGGVFRSFWIVLEVKLRSFIEPCCRGTRPLSWRSATPPPSPVHPFLFIVFYNLESIR